MEKLLVRVRIKPSSHIFCGINMLEPWLTCPMLKEEENGRCSCALFGPLEEGIRYGEPMRAKACIRAQKESEKIEGVEDVKTVDLRSLSRIFDKERV